jgi:hypothetical protein
VKEMGDRWRWGIRAWLALLRYSALRPIALVLLLVAKALQRCGLIKAAAWVYAIRSLLLLDAIYQQLTFVYAVEEKLLGRRLAAVAVSIG